MSYSLMSNCYLCKKGGQEWESKCIDKTILNNSISTIHMIGAERGHLGAGCITLDCQNFEEGAVEV